MATTFLYLSNRNIFVRHHNTGYLYVSQACYEILKPKYIVKQRQLLCHIVKSRGSMVSQINHSQVW